MPSYALVARREPFRSEKVSGRVNVRVTEPIPYGDSPDQIRQSDYNMLGKPVEHALSRNVVAFTSSPESYFAVMADNFGTGKYFDPAAPSPTAGKPRGIAQPYRERSNIAKVPAAAYGTLFELNDGNLG